MSSSMPICSRSRVEVTSASARLTRADMELSEVCEVPSGYRTPVTHRSIVTPHVQASTSGPQYGALSGVRISALTISGQWNAGLPQQVVSFGRLLLKCVASPKSSSLSCSVSGCTMTFSGFTSRWQTRSGQWIACSAMSSCERIFSAASSESVGAPPGVRGAPCATRDSRVVYPSRYSSTR